MFKHFFVSLIVAGVGCFIYGAWNIFLEVEDNECRMTYMFGQPQFSKVKVRGNAQFPNYGLYYYYEGRQIIDVNSLNLRGAPVIFIPGSAGSHKQVRSFASVALRKSMDSDARVHFDYFTVSTNEEHSGIFGGYLEIQKAYLRLCILTVLQLYKNNPHAAKKVVVIGHSMGGKVAQALFSSDVSMAHLINSIIFVSAPLDAPVVNFDALMEHFYADAFRNMSRNRASYMPHNDTNRCTQIVPHQHGALSLSATSHLLENVLLISIGGGNRDLIVRDALTQSIFSDIHSMTSAIPHVWLSCDHMSSVWCLQFVLATNRFLFSIAAMGSHGFVTFQEEKALRLKSAYHHFVKPKINTKNRDFDLSRVGTIWQQCSGRVMQKHFKAALPKPYNLMISLQRYEHFRKLYVEMLNAPDNNWLFGCVAQMSSPQKYTCEHGITLAHHTQPVAVRHGVVTRTEAFLDLHNLRKTYTNWTHVMLHLPNTHSNKPLGFNIDIYEGTERILRAKAPRWFNIMEQSLLNETAQGTLYYKLLVSDMEASYQSLQLNIRPRACLSEAATYQVRTRICVPWARGYERQQILTEKTASHIYVNAPMPGPIGYNSTRNSVSVEIYLDPNCRFSLSYQFSIANTLSRILLEFYTWLPSHLVAVLCIVLKNQLGKLHKPSSGVAGRVPTSKPYAGYFQYTSLYIITSCRIFRKLIPPAHHLAAAGVTHHPAYGFPAAVIVHSTAIALAVLLSLTVWLFIVLHGSLLHNIAVRLTRIPLASFTLLITFVTKFPLSMGVLAIAIAMATCSCVSLLLSCCIYLTMLSNAYKDHLEGWVWTLGSTALRKCFRKTQSRSNQAAPTQSAVTVSAELESLTLNSETKNETSDNASDVNGIEAAAGMQHFPFHITMFLFLLIVTLLNMPAGVAWLRNYRTGQRLPDPALPATIVVLVNLSLLWQLNAPNPCYGFRPLSVALYLLAAAAVVYCQEAVYLLHYIVAVIYTTVLIPEVAHKIWHRLAII